MNNREYDAARMNIAVHGVHLHWSATKPSSTCYTVGLQRFEHPELIVFGAGGEDAQFLLNNYAFRVRDGVQRFDEPCEVPDFGNGYPVRLCPVADSSKHLKIANAMYRAAGKPAVAALQLVVPDSKHRWPWEAGNAFKGQHLLAPASFDYEAPLPLVELAPHDPDAPATQ